MPQAAGIKLSGTFLSIAGVMFANIPGQGPETAPAADAEVRSIDKDQFILTTVCTANRMAWDVILFQFRGVVSAIENLSRERVSGFFVSQIPLFFGFIEETVLRDDDKPETVQKRLSVYHEQTQPLIDYYKAQGILKSVDGTKPMDEVFTDIVAILGE